MANLQGDATTILDSTGAVMVNYHYDAYGVLLQTGGTMATTIGALNATGVVYAVVDGANHVSVFPVGGTLEDWHNAGASSVWTVAVKSVVTKLPGR